MSTVPLDVRVSLLRRYGNFPQAYSVAVQPALSHFGDARGFIAYKMIGRTAYVLADPVAEPQHRTELIADFVDQARDVVFCQASRPMAEYLADHGFLVNDMGFDTRVDMTGMKFSGRRNRNWKTAANRIAAQGITIKECTAEQIDPVALDGISSRWRQTTSVKGHEVCFLTRPFQVDDDPDLRRFVAFDRANQPIAFNIFDPIYDAETVTGYVAQFKRRLPEVESVVNQAIMRTAIEAFQQEQKKWLFLGLAPLADIARVGLPESSLVRRSFRTTFNNRLFNRYIYPLQGHAQHKRLFHGTTEKTYFVFNRRHPLPRILKLLRACRLVPFWPEERTSRTAMALRRSAERT